MTIDNFKIIEDIVDRKDHVSAYASKIIREALVAIREERDIYQECYEAWWEVEKGIVDFDLHHTAVDRLQAAHKRASEIHNG